MSTTRSRAKNAVRKSASKKTTVRYLTTNTSKIQRAFDAYKAQGKAGRTAALKALKNAG